MRISLESVIDKIIWLLTVFLLSSFLIFETYAWGRYAFFGASILILLLSAISYGGILRIRLQPYHIFFLLFIAFAAMSSLWAIRSSDAIGKASTLFRILVCAAMLYIHYDRKDHIRPLLLAVMWAGYFVTLYAITFYGLDTMLESSQDIRLENEFSNVNTIAMSAAISCILQWHELLSKRNLWSSVLVIPSVILITATQSRKAFVMLLAGIVLVYTVKTMRQKGFAKKLLKLILYMVLMFVALRLLFQLPIFSGSLERMDKLLNFWSNEGTADNSTIVRNNMAQLGIEWFKKYPIGGVGIGNPHILADRYLNFDAYLHNNFVELLCGGGVIGFALYYGMYAYLFISLFKYRKVDRDAVSIAFVWLTLMLIMNYGMVTYYSKLQWYYLTIHFINVGQLKKKHMEMIQNAQELPSQRN